MNCKIVSNNIFFYLDNELSEENRINFESHLKLCPQCKVLFENVASTYNLILEENQVAGNPFFYHKLKAKIETKEESHIIKGLSNILKPLAIAASVALGIMIGNGELDVLNITIDDTEIISESFTPVLPADYSLWITMNEEDGSEN